MGWSLTWLGAVIGVALMLGGCSSGKQERPFASGSSSTPDAATDAFEAGADRPPTLKTMYAMASLFAAQRKDNECEWALKQILRDYPQYAPAYCMLAELYMRQERVDVAVATLEAGLRATPNAPILLNNLGMCRLLKGDYEQALQLFTQASAATPQDVRYRANMAAALGMLGRYDESLSLFEQIMTPADAHFNLAVLCEARKDASRALEEYTQATKLSNTKKSD